MNICPLCLDVYAVNGSCSCDVDGIPPGGWQSCPWSPPVNVLLTAAGPGVRSSFDSLVDLGVDPVALEWALRGSLRPRRQVLVSDDALVRDALPTEGSCACGRPTRDHAYMCTSCVIRLGELLEQLPQVFADLDARLTAGIRGIDYRALALPSSSSNDYRPGALPMPAEAWLRANEEQGTANPTGLPILPHVVEARAELIRGIRWLVAAALQARLTPDQSVRVTDVSSWLRVRVDAMALHWAFYGHRQILEHLVERALSRVAEYAGSDDWRERPGNVDTLMSAALTASEIAAMTIRVGELDGTHARDTTALRERIRTTVNDWHRRGRIHPVSHTDSGRPRFRFGEVHLLLLRAPAPRPAARPEPTPARPGLDALASWPNHPTEENR